MDEHEDALSERVESGLRRHPHEVSPWRIFKIMAEFVMGFEFLKKYEHLPSVTFFGSARCDLDDSIYQEATKLAKLLAQAGFTVITGGGPGIMEAANRGATEAGGNSLGLNIKLPAEQTTNQYVKDGETFHYFFTRKVMLSFAAELYIFFPGGFGTLDELTEIVTLVQTKKIRPVPVILVGRDFWQPFLDWIETKLIATYHTIDEQDKSIYHLVDSADEALTLAQQLLKRR